MTTEEMLQSLVFLAKENATRTAELEVVSEILEAHQKMFAALFEVVVPMVAHLAKTEGFTEQGEKLIQVLRDFREEMNDILITQEMEREINGEEG